MNISLFQSNFIWGKISFLVATFIATDIDSSYIYRDRYRPFKRAGNFDFSEPLYSKRKPRPSKPKTWPYRQVLYLSRRVLRGTEKFSHSTLPVSFECDLHQMTVFFFTFIFLNYYFYPNLECCDAVFVIGRFISCMFIHLHDTL